MDRLIDFIVPERGISLVQVLAALWTLALTIGAHWEFPSTRQSGTRFGDDWISWAVWHVAVININGFNSLSMLHVIAVLSKVHLEFSINLNVWRQSNTILNTSYLRNFQQNPQQTPICSELWRSTAPLRPAKITSSDAASPGSRSNTGDTHNLMSLPHIKGLWVSRKALYKTKVLLWWSGLYFLEYLALDQRFRQADTKLRCEINIINGIAKTLFINPL